MNIDWQKISDYLDTFTTSGWRKLFFWSSVGAMAIALPIVYVYEPLSQHYAPAEFLTQLNGTMVIVTGLAGLRAVEKHQAAKLEAASV